MLTLQEEQLLMMLPETDYGRALTAWLNERIREQENKEPGKISNDPLLEDFRVQMGIKLGFKEILEKPQELKTKQRVKDY